MRNNEREKFLKICREVGWKCTSQRLAVYEFLTGNLTHPDVDAVWTAVRATQPAITRESVYRILNEFSAKGIIRRLDQIDAARYDSRTGPHGHFICGKCGEISDFDWPGGTTLRLEEMPGDVTHMEIRLAGVCRKCANQQRTTPPKPNKPGGNHEKHHQNRTAVRPPVLQVSGRSPVPARAHRRPDA